VNEYEIECEVCESVVIVYNDAQEEPGWCPQCGSALLSSEVTDV